MIYNKTLNDYGKVCNSCTIYVVLLVIFLIISISISSVFIYLFSLILKKKIYWNNNLLDIWMGNIKQINIKNQTYYFFNDMINIKDFDSNLLKIDKKS